MKYRTKIKREDQQKKLVKELVEKNRVQMINFLINRERKRLNFESLDEFSDETDVKILYTEDLVKGLITRKASLFERVTQKITFEEQIQKVPGEVYIGDERLDGYFTFNIIEELLNEGIYHLNGTSLYKKYATSLSSLTHLINSNINFYRLKEIARGSDRTPILFWHQHKELGIILAPKVK